MNLREAAEMALEVLETTWGDGHEDTLKQWEETIQALRQALDKPDIDPQALVQMAVLAEREACAKVCDDWQNSFEIDTRGWWASSLCAQAIRARGEK